MRSGLGFTTEPPPSQSNIWVDKGSVSNRLHDVFNVFLAILVMQACICVLGSVSLLRPTRLRATFGFIRAPF